MQSLRDVQSPSVVRVSHAGTSQLPVGMQYPDQQPFVMPGSVPIGQVGGALLHVSVA
jgi:hypothetical protein